MEVLKKFRESSRGHGDFLYDAFFDSGPDGPFLVAVLKNKSDEAKLKQAFPDGVFDEHRIATAVLITGVKPHEPIHKKKLNNRLEK